MNPSRILLLWPLLLVPTASRAQAPVTPSREPCTATIAPVPDACESCLPAGAFDPPSNATVNDRLQLSASYLLWWINRDHASLRVLTTGGAGTGILGQPDTQ